MKQLLLLWLAMSGGLLALVLVLVLAVLLVLAMLFAVAWSLRAVLRLLLGRSSTPDRGADVVSGAGNVTVHTHVSGRVRPSGARRPVRVQAGLVPSALCVARGDLDGVPGRRRRRPR